MTPLRICSPSPFPPPRPVGCADACGPTPPRSPARRIFQSTFCRRSPPHVPADALWVSPPFPSSSFHLVPENAAVRAYSPAHVRNSALPAGYSGRARHPRCKVLDDTARSQRLPRPTASEASHVPARQWSASDRPGCRCSCLVVHKFDGEHPNVYTVRPVPGGRPAGASMGWTWTL